MEDKVLEIKALGRPCFLGQLYDAKTSSLLPGFSLFKRSDIQSRASNVNSTKFDFTEVNSHSDRASSLDVSVEMSVSILSGAFSVGGSGAYLSNKQDTSESTTVAAIAQYRTTSKSLDLNALRTMVDIDQEMLAKICATHVVTGIVYGGNIVGTLTQKSTNKADNTKIKTNFSIEAFNNMGQWLSAGAKTTISVEERKKINSFNLHIDLCADFPLKKNTAPTDPVSMIEAVKSSELVGDGVPCEVFLTPLPLLVDNIPGFRELSKADLIDIMDLYDHIIKLENSRAWLHDAVDAYSGIFPTFTGDIRGRTIKTTKLVQDARDNLRRYLQNYRGELPDIEPPSEFVKGVAARFNAAMAEYEKDKDEWRRYQDRLSAAEQHGFPILGVTAVGSKMSRTDKGMLAAILVPENANWKALVDLYGDLAMDIRQWRESIDKPSQGKDDGTAKSPETIYVSIYADPLHDTTLESLDDEAGTLKSALASARGTKRAVFLTYGRSRGHIGGTEWNVLNKEGWGIIINKEENWRYIGDVHLSKPHGSGIITYVNQTKYVGDFVNGQRDGYGKIVSKDGKTTGGVFIKNVHVPQGILVEVTVVNKIDIPIQFRKVALDKFGSVWSHVDRIGTIMGWELKQRFCLNIEGVSEVYVLGNMIDPREPPSLETSTWKLEGTPKVTAQMI